MKNLEIIELFETLEKLDSKISELKDRYCNGDIAIIPEYNQIVVAIRSTLTLLSDYTR